MKKYIVILTLMVALAPSLYGQERVGRPTVGLVLAGGGAKGAAHIGVIKLIEEVGIPVDYIAGTSMGSIIGGMYALGYTSAEMDSIISNMDWGIYMSNKVDRRETSYEHKTLDSKYLIDIPFDIPNKINEKLEKGMSEENPEEATLVGQKSFVNSLPGGYINGNNIFNMLNSLAVGYQDSIDFDTLPIPYACVSVNAIDGTQKIHRDGTLPMAMRASMAIPGVFTPVQIGDEVLVDGGMLNNFPVDVCKAMGADIIIGVNLSGGLSSDAQKLNALPGLLGQLFGIVTGSQVQEHAKMCNIYLNPNLKEGGYGTLSFDKKSIQEIMEIGYNTALSKRGEFEALKKELESYGADLTQKYNNKKAINLLTEKIKVSEVVWNGVRVEDVPWLEKKSRLDLSSPMTKNDIDKAVSFFYGTKAFSNITYYVRKMEGDDTGYQLEFVFKLNEPNSFKLGFRFDSYETAALGFRFAMNEHRLRGFKASLSTKLSYNPWVKVSASYAAGVWPNVNVEYYFKENDIDINENGNQFVNIRSNRQDVKVFISQFYSKNIGAGGGLDFQMYRTPKYLSLTDVEQVAFAPVNTLGAFVYFDYDTRDRDIFPNRGVDLNLHGVWNFYQFGNSVVDFDQPKKLKLGQAYGSLVSYIPIGRRFNLIPQAYAGMVFAKDAYYHDDRPIYDYFANFIGGGQMQGRHFEQELPFVGINKVEYVYNNVVILRLDFRWEVFDKFYLTAMSNYLHDANELKHFFQPDYTDNVWGFGVQSGYQSAIGPVSLDLHWASHTKKMGAFLNIGYYF